MASYDETVPIRIVDVASGKEARKLSGGDWLVECVEWNPQRPLLAWSTRGSDVVTIGEASGRKLRALYGHTRLVTTLDWSPDGRRLATAGIESVIRIWDIADPQRGSRQAVAEGLAATDTAWSPDGKYLAMAAGPGSSMIAVVDPVGGRIIRSRSLGQGSARRVAWSPAGDRLAISGSTGASGVALWDSGLTKQVDRVPGLAEPVESLRWSPEGRYLALSSHREVRIWDCQARSPAGAWTNDTGYDIRFIVWEPTGRELLMAYKDRLVKLRVGLSEQIELSASESGAPDISDWRYWYRTGALSPDGRRLATALFNVAVIRERGTGRLLGELRGQERGISSIDWSPDGTRLVTTSNDPTIRIWDAATGREVLALEEEPGELTAASWSPDGRRVAARAKDGGVRILDASAGYEKGRRGIPRERRTASPSPASSAGDHDSRTESGVRGGEGIGMRDER